MSKEKKPIHLIDGMEIGEITYLEPDVFKNDGMETPRFSFEPVNIEIPFESLGSPKLREMVEMQEAFNQATFAERGTSYEKILSEDGFFYALLDEFGEWNHERKDHWCWWKKTQKPADRGKELEEFVDILHFVISRQLASYDADYIVTLYTLYSFADIERDQAFLIYMILLGSQKRAEGEFLDSLLAVYFKLASLCGYSFDEIYEAYKAKNAENFERLANGY